MSDKKHIDRIFKEGFKDFEATPRPVVWKNIEKQISSNKKSKIIPIGWRYAGVAASLLLLLTIGINYFNNDGTPKNQIVDTENNNPDNIVTDGPDLNNNTNKTNQAIVNSNPDTIDKIKDEEKISNQPKNSISNKVPSLKETTVAETLSSQNENESKGVYKSKVKNESKAIIVSHPNNEQQVTIQNNNHNLPIYKNKVEAILNEVSEQSGIAKNETSEKQNSNKNPIDGSKENNSIAKNDDLLIDNNKAEDLFNTSENNDIAQNTISEKGEEKTRDSINETQDSIIALEDAIDKTEDNIEEEKQNRWRIAPNAAPVYFSTLGEGSTIDPQFNSNAKTSEINMSFGISASYAVTKKLRIRSGVNRVNLGYNTNDVIVYNTTGTASSLQNVRTNTPESISDALSSKNTGNLAVLNAQQLNAQEVLSLDSAFTPKPVLLTNNTSINQTLAYIEVPLEIEYNLLDKKFGVHVIGGFSSFFLTDNKLFSETSDGSQTILGEATNINDVSYSANFGLGLNYKMSKKIDLNLEPMFKYQINTFNNTSGDFKPFFIGVYTGFSIKF